MYQNGPFSIPFSIFKISQCENLGKNRAKFGQNSGIIRANILAPFCFLLACQNIIIGNLRSLHVPLYADTGIEEKFGRENSDKRI